MPRNSKFQQPMGFKGSIRVTMPNFVTIDQTVADIWQFFFFNDRRPPSRIFKNSKF